jgi:hypothetical protein
MVVLDAVRSNPWLQYCERLRAAGKPEKVDAIAATRKLLRGIWNVATHREAFRAAIVCDGASTPIANYTLDGGRKRTLRAVPRSENDLQRLPTYGSQLPRYPRRSRAKREIGQSGLEAAPRFLKCRGLECALRA